MLLLKHGYLNPTRLACVGVSMISCTQCPACMQHAQTVHRWWRRTRTVVSVGKYVDLIVAASYHLKVEAKRRVCTKGCRLSMLSIPSVHSPYSKQLFGTCSQIFLVFTSVYPTSWFKTVSELQVPIWSHQSIRACIYSTNEKSSIWCVTQPQLLVLTWCWWNYSAMWLERTEEVQARNKGRVVYVHCLHRRV